MPSFFRRQGRTRPAVEAASPRPTAGPSARDLGDAARERRDWPAAVEAYRRHLETKSDDQPIWVQLGHALKEAGDRDAAETAYRRAVELAPKDADARLHFGHLMKIAGRRDDAIRAYAEALERNPTLQDAFHELRTAGEMRRALRVLDAALGETGRLGGEFYEIGDMLDYFRHHPRPSGIQRVQIELCRRLIGREGVRFVSFFPLGHPLLLPEDGVRELLEAVERDDVEVRDLIEVVEKRIVARAEPALLRRDSRLMVLGAFWNMPHAFVELAQLRRSGVRVGVYVYDLIPMTHPEFCDTPLVQSFRRCFAQMTQIADFMLTISKATAREVRAELGRLGVEIPVEAVPLSHALQFVTEETDAATAAALRRRGVEGPYVLCVGTVEVRKNHALLFQIWRRLQRQRGDALPTLIFVGRAGWRVRDLMEQIEATRFVDGKLLILNDLSHRELTTLYRGALFTVFPSFVEGWGLPVGESLMFGKPCAASNTSSIPEVGGELVDYFDPWNVAEAEAVIARLLFDEAYCEGRARAIRETFRPRSWDEVTETFVEACARLAGSEGGAGGVPRIEPGRLHNLGVSGRDGEAAEDGLIDLACPVDAWHPVEPWGMWAAKARATLTFQMRRGANEPVYVYALTRRSPMRPDHGVEIVDLNDDAPPVLVRGSLGRIEARPDGDGVIRLALDTVHKGEAQRLPSDLRDIHVGLVAFGFARDLEETRALLQDAVDHLAA